MSEAHVHSTTQAGLTGLIEAVANRYLALDPEGRQRLAELAGRVIGIEIRGLGLHLFLFPSAEGLTVLGHFEGEPDTWIRGAPLALLRLARAPEDKTNLFGGDVSVEGDTHLAARFSRILGDLDVDWEEAVARASNDFVAHQAGLRVRQLAAWGRRAASSLREDIADYLQEESRQLPAGAEAEWRYAEIDALRDACERLEARVRRIESRLKNEDGTA